MRKLLNTSARYGLLSMGLHWLMLLLLIGVFACISLSDSFPENSSTETLLKTSHFTLGLTVFALAWVRLLAKLVSPAPVIEPPIAVWQDRTSKVVQALLYGLMFCMPVLGWLSLSSSGKQIPFFGWQLPALIAQNKDFEEIIKSIHEAGAATLLVLVGVHAAAALYHHYLLRDNTLRRMLP